MQVHGAASIAAVAAAATAATLAAALAAAAVAAASATAAAAAAAVVAAVCTWRGHDQALQLRRGLRRSRMQQARVGDGMPSCILVCD